jgi:DNA replicative helicase MCM subunit Mcm2 (Cdc46/Mcm family)
MEENNNTQPIAIKKTYYIKGILFDIPIEDYIAIRKHQSDYGGVEEHVAQTNSLDIPQFSTPEEKIRELRTYHIGTMIRVRGVITKKYPTYQKLKKLFYICIKCSDKKGPIYQNDEEDMQLGHCAGCQSKGPYKISDEERVYGVNQKIII